MKFNSTDTTRDTINSDATGDYKKLDSMRQESQRKSRNAATSNEHREEANFPDESSHSEDSEVGVLDFSITTLSRSHPSDDAQGNTSTFMGFLQNLVQNNGAFNLSHSNDEFDCIIENLVQRDDAYLILECAKDLSERLLMMDNVTADRVIPSSRLTSALIKILSDRSLACDLEIHLVVCRCLYHLMELHEAFVIEAIHNNAVEAILPHLVEIVYIDLTEQCLQVLETLSKENSAHHRLIENDGVHACLKNLDFLTIHSQKKCLKIISNSACSVLPTHFMKFENDFATLLDILVTQDDAGMVEHARQIVFKIINCFQHDSKKIELLFKNEALISRFTEFAFDSFEKISLSKVELHSPTIILRSLICLASASKSIRDTLLKEDLGAKISSTILKDEEFSGTPKLAPTTDHFFGDILKLIGSFIPNPNKSEETDTYFGNFPYWEGLLEESHYNLRDFCRFIEQVYPILIHLYHEAMEYEVQCCVMQELVKIFYFCEKFSLTPAVNHRESVDIVSNILFDWKKVLSDIEPEAEKFLKLNLVFAACLITQSAFHSWDSKHIDLLNRVGVLEYLRDLLKFLRNKSQILKTSDLRSQKRKYLLRVLTDITQEILNQDSLRISRECAIANHLKILANLQHSFRLQSVSKTPVYERNRELWSKFIKLFSSDDYPTCHELHSLGILESILEQLNLMSSNEPVLLQSLVSVMIDDPASFIRFVNCLHEIVSKVLIPHVTSSRSKTDSAELRLIEGKRVLIKIMSKNVKPVSQLSHREGFKQELVLLVPAVVSFATIRSLLIRYSKLFPNLEPNFHAFSSPKSDSFLETSTVFYYHGVAICNATPLYSVITALDPSSSEIKCDPIASIWGKTHEFSFSNETVPKTQMQIEPLKASLFEIISLSILKSLFSINEKLFSWNGRFKTEVFRNRILDQLLLKQIESVSVTRIGELQELCVHLMTKFPFLFLFRVKLQFIRSVCFGMARSVNFSAETQSKQSKQNLLSYELCGAWLNSAGFLSKTKLRVSRTKIFKSALAVLDSYSLNPSSLEFQFYDEEGSGLGPTLEFYSLVSKSFSQISFMWNTSAREGYGLFPAPIYKTDLDFQDRSSNLFQKLGNFLARAFLDSRPVDFHFNPLLLQAIQDWTKYSKNIMSCECLEYVVQLLHEVDPILASSLRQLVTSLDPGTVAYDTQSGNMSADSELDDLCLTFVLPGSINYELVKNGKNIKVTRQNVNRYIILVAKTILCEGIKLQVQSLREGFSQLLPLLVLQILSLSELDELFGHGRENWSMEVLKACVEADHGYSCESPSVVNCLSILNEFSREEKRQFLQFLTGSPRLPVGGFPALHPKLTIVKKYVDQGSTTDGQLPSVMTCANYLKLPDYSLKSLMRSRIIQAMREGSGEFFLS